MGGIHMLEAIDAAYGRFQQAKETRESVLASMILVHIFRELCEKEEIPGDFMIWEGQLHCIAFPWRSAMG